MSRPKCTRADREWGMFLGCGAARQASRRGLLDEHGADAVMDAVARAIPARIRPSPFAVLADLLLADGKMDRQERRFLQRIALWTHAKTTVFMPRRSRGRLPSVVAL